MHGKIQVCPCPVFQVSDDMEYVRAIHRGSKYEAWQRFARYANERELGWTPFVPEKDVLLYHYYDSDIGKHALITKGLRAGGSGGIETSPSI